MKTTLEIPDDLHRRAKAKAASEGITISSVLRDSLERYVGVIGFIATESHMDGDTRVIDSVKPMASATMPRAVVRPKLDLTKAAQVKGKMGR